VPSALTPTLGSAATTALRWAFGIFFLVAGVGHFVVPDGLPEPASWMYDLSDTVHVVAGTAEILGGLGLILPRLVGRARGLTVAAALGLAMVMIGASVWHLTRSEWPQAIGNLVIAWILATLAVNEWRHLGR
jgi:uncharacterized membrane protein